MVGCNCITKVLLADTKIKSKMPLLAVQIDNNFISLNLYEQGQLSFSRFASIDPDDYGGSSDYVFEAVNENIFRMLQFHRSRNTGETIENIIFYGDTHDYVRLTDELEKLDLNTSLINVPPQIHGHENLEFSLYANAIGAMFKRNKESEKINLLETELGAAIKRAGTTSINETAGSVIMLSCILGSAILVGGIWGVMGLINHGVKSDINEIRAYIEDPATVKQLQHREKLLGIQEKVNAYNSKIVNAHDAFYSQPVIDGDKYEAYINTLKKTAESLSLSDVEMTTPSYAAGAMSFNVTAQGSKEMVQKLPSLYIDNLLDEGFEENKGYYMNATYGGYNVNISAEENGGAEEEKVTFSVTAAINGRESAYKPEGTDNADTEEKAE
jgi:type IV pilus assembly protein PilM